MPSSVAPTDRRRRVLLRIGLLALRVARLALAGQRRRRRHHVQTNAPGDNVTPHRPDHDTPSWRRSPGSRWSTAPPAPDGSRLYLSNESTETLDIVDTKTLKVRKQIPLRRSPEQPGDSRERETGLRRHPRHRGRRRRHRPRRRGAPPVSSGSCGACTTPSSRRTANTSWPGRVAAGRHGHRHRARAAGLGDSLRGRRAAAHLRHEPGRLDAK